MLKESGLSDEEDSESSSDSPLSIEAPLPKSTTTKADPQAVNKMSVTLKANTTSPKPCRCSRVLNHIIIISSQAIFKVD